MACSHTDTQHKQEFHLYVYAKPAFAIQIRRPQPITTNPITFYMQHLISRKGLLGLGAERCDSSKHMWDRCVCEWADLQVIPRLAHRHVWLAACRFHHIAPETETDLMASHPQVSLFLPPPLSLFVSQSGWAELWARRWLTLVLSGRPSCREALWLKRQNKAHTATFEAAVLCMTVSQIIRVHARQIREDTLTYSHECVRT